MLTLAGEVRDELLEHAREGTPREVCGVLGGEYGPERSRATVAHRAANAAATPETRYEIDPAEQYELMTRIEDAGREVVGFYHSHPAGPPGPSATDAARATWEGYSYVVVALDGDPDVGSWRWTGERFEREPVERA